MIVTLILTMRATKHDVTSFKFLGSVVASKKTTNCVWMIVKRLKGLKLSLDQRVVKNV